MNGTPYCTYTKTGDFHNCLVPTESAKIDPMCLSSSSRACSKIKLVEYRVTMATYIIEK